ncbi:uncharacterized protein LOC106649943 [Trichogramma pretiosum]|uniref:uncharacterized protein LOC106649943 n=1 Tax=Trichogramma pretiosum TaxID=7493 RepID=UPI0006C955C1|nr:uncharacterized protein LOC106649943 [Trichogramma pretiosum]
MCEVVTIDWLGISDPEEKDTMKVVCKRGSRLIFIHFGVLLPVFACYALGPVALPYVLNPYLPENMTLQKTLCVHVELFIDQEKYFYYILAFSIHILTLVMLIICALDLAYTSCITYVMGKIIWIGYVFEKLCEIKTSNQNLSAKRKIDIYVHQTVIGLIKRHQKCLEFSQTLNDACSPKFIIVMSGFMICLSLSGSMAVVEISYDAISAAKMAVSFVLILILVIVICYPSQLLIDASNEIYFKCYCSKWYEYPVRTRKLLILMMTRAAEPCCMTIGPTMPLNFETAGVVSNDRHKISF